MSAELVFPLVAILGGLIGAIYDLRIREVPNWINYFMIFFGLGGYLIISVLNLSVLPFILSLIVALAFYGLAAAMFYSGQWGGGDAKMLIGFGALLPAYPAILKNWFSPEFSFWPFPVTIFLNIVLVGGIIGLITILFLISKKPREFWAEFKQQAQASKNWFKAVLLVLLIPLASLFFGAFVFLASFLAWVAISFLLVSFLAAKSVEKTCMIRAIKPKKLTIGDWLADEVIVSNNVVCKPKGAGLLESEIKKLVALEKTGKLKEVKIKIGLPFVPSFFLGLIVSLVFGDLIFTFVGLFF